MTKPEAEGPVGRGIRALASTDWRARAKKAAAALKADYEAGKQGDDQPVEPIWPTAKEQLDGIVAMVRSARSAPSRTAEQLDTDAADVASALGGIDWAGVKATTAERTGPARKAMREMSDQVDWAKVQPVAAQVSSALIAAVASGQLGVGGRLGSSVIRTIANQSGMAQKVAENLTAQKTTLPPDFRQVIDTTARDS